MLINEQPVALPKLYGAPAYARPPAPVVGSVRPFDPDVLPLQVEQTEEERRFAAYPQAHAYESGAGGLHGEQRDPGDHGANGRLRPRLFSLRAIAGRLLGGD